MINALKNRLLSIAICVLMACSIGASGAVQYVLYMFAEDGNTAFLLSDCPVIIKEGDNIKVTTSQTEVVVLESMVSKFTLEKEEIGDEDLPTRVEGLRGESGTINRHAGVVEFQGFSPLSVVGVFSANGVAISTYKTDENGYLLISIESYPAGVYLIKTENITYKIIKK